MFKKYAILAFAVSLGLGALPASAALKTFSVNYGEGTTLDENFGAVEVDGVSVTPPAYACGRRLYDAAELIWISFDHFKQGLNPDQTVDVWLPRPTCPNKTAIIIERNADKVDYLPPNPNTFPLEFAYLETHYSSRWIDSQGKVKPLNLPQLPYTNKVAKWAAMPAQIIALKAQIIDPDTQSRAYFTAQQQQADVAELARDLSDRIALRRRTNLPDRETALREVEDAGSAQLGFASTQLSAASRYARSAMYAEAYLAADLASAAMTKAHAYVGEAEELISTEAE